VLADSNAIAERVMREWGERHGVPFASILAVHRGRPTVETVRLVAPRLDAVAEARAIEAVEAEDTEGLVAFPGAARLVVAASRARWAIVTSGGRRLAANRLRRIGLPAPDILVTADDVTRGKPAPDPYRLAMARLGVDAAHCVVIEDAPAGVASARAAGACVVAVASTTAPHELRGADVVVPALDDLDVEPRAGTLHVTWRTTVTV
jgi:sugar-phosphatase